MNEGRPQDVGELHDEPLERCAECAPLLLLRGFPQVRDNARRHRSIAIDHFTVELKLIGEMLQNCFRRRVVGRSKSRGGRLPELGETATRASGEQQPHFVLEP